MKYKGFKKVLLMENELRESLVRSVMGHATNKVLSPHNILMNRKYYSTGGGTKIKFTPWNTYQYNFASYGLWGEISQTSNSSYFLGYILQLITTSTVWQMGSYFVVLLNALTSRWLWIGANIKKNLEYYLFNIFTVDDNVFSLYKTCLCVFYLLYPNAFYFGIVEERRIFK